MNKTLFVALALFAIVNASLTMSATIKLAQKIQSERVFEERQSSSCPFKGACVKRSGSCTNFNYLPAPCQSCVDALTTCLTNAAGNQTVSCNCFITAVTCSDNTGLPNCPGSTFRSTCLQLPSLVGSSCTCGTASTNQLTVNICDASNYCANATSTCTALSPVNGACATSSDCGYSNAPITIDNFVCTAGVCKIAPGSVANGDPCSGNLDCVSGTCTGGVCVGKTSGSSCSESGECAFGLFCNNGNCAAQAAAGAACSYSSSYASADEACALGYSCASGICVKYFSLASGTACNDTFQCASGLICNQATMKCQSPAAAKSCSANADCPVDQGYTGQCSCGFSGTQACTPIPAFPASFISSYNNLITCAASNKCSSISQNPNSCVMKNCMDQGNCALNAYADYFYVDGCEGNMLECKSAAGLIQVSLFLIGALVAFLF